MSTQNNKRKLDDAYGLTFDLLPDMMTEVFSHVQCVKTRHSLNRVSKLWRKASKTAAAYPLRFDFDAFPYMSDWTRRRVIVGLLDNDEALSLPYERVVGLLGEAAINVCGCAARRGSVRLLKWARENNLAWSVETSHCAARNGHLPALKYLHENGCPWDLVTCCCAAINGHLPALKYLHENGCPWDSRTCWYAASHGHLPTLQYLHENGCPWDSNTGYYAAYHKRWDCLQYAVDNKAPGWEHYGKNYAEHLR